jgi:sulfite reductase (NADPH) flavoprotein alpha-component
MAIIVSTWRDGEPPESIESFYQTLMKDRVDLSGVQYGVCALGDTGYDKFCQTGKEFDSRLEVLGTTRMVDRMDCDVDFEDALKKAKRYQRDVY